MELVNRLEKKNAEARVSGKHPLFELGADRNVRTAYFQGLTLVALVDDGKSDSKEPVYLQKLGTSLGMTPDDVLEAIAVVAKLQGDVDQQEALFSDVDSTMSDPEMRKFFLAELTRLSTVHDHDLGKVEKLRSAFAKRMKCDLKGLGFEKFDKVLLGFPKTAADVPALEKLFSKSTLDYLFPDYEEETAKQREVAKKEKSVERARLGELKKWLLALVKKDEWVDDYDVEEIREKFKWAGIKDHWQIEFLKLLTPCARKAFDAFKLDFQNMEYLIIGRSSYSNGYSRVVTISKRESGRKLLNFCSLMNAVTTNANEYRIVDGPNDDSEEDDVNGDDVNFKELIHDQRIIGATTPSRIVWSSNSKDGDKDARNSCFESFDRILSEFEFRATW